MEKKNQTNLSLITKQFSSKTHQLPLDTIPATLLHSSYFEYLQVAEGTECAWANSPQLSSPATRQLHKWWKMASPSLLGFFWGLQGLKKKKIVVCFSKGIRVETMQTMHIVVILKRNTSENQVCVCIDGATHQGKKKLGKKVYLKTVSQ